ncbi:MAG: hypothetical protein WD114_06230 [Phycisphaerales bacterium]
MLHVLKQWAARALSLCVIGPAAAWVAHRVLAADGTHQTTLLTGDSLTTGLSSLVGVALLVLLTGVIVARLVDRREGLLNMAFVLGWVAWTSGQLGEVFRVRPDTGTLVMLAAEGLLLTGAVLLAGVLMTDPQRGGRMGQPDDVSRFDLPLLFSSLTSKPGLAAMLAGIVGAAAVAMLFGQSDLPGQSVGVGFGAGILGGVAGAMAAGSMRGGDEELVATPYAPIMLGVMLCAVIAPLLGIVRPGAGDLAGLVVRGDLPGYLIVSPSAWVICALLGVPVGHSWVEHSAAQANATTPAMA